MLEKRKAATTLVGVWVEQQQHRQEINSNRATSIFMIEKPKPTYCLVQTCRLCDSSSIIQRLPSDEIKFHQNIISANHRKNHKTSKSERLLILPVLFHSRAHFLMKLSENDVIVNKSRSTHEHTQHFFCLIPFYVFSRLYWTGSLFIFISRGCLHCIHSKQLVQMKMNCERAVFCLKILKIAYDEHARRCKRANFVWWMNYSAALKQSWCLKFPTSHGKIIFMGTAWNMSESIFAINLNHVHIWYSKARKVSLHSWIKIISSSAQTVPRCFPIIYTRIVKRNKGRMLH